MEQNETQEQILNNENFIKSNKYHNSLSNFLIENPDGVEDSVIAKVLLMSEDEVKEVYAQAVVKLRELMTEKEL